MRDAGKILFFASGTHFMVHLYENSFGGILKSLQNEWGGDYAAIGTLGLPLFFLFGLMAVPGGWLADRYGSKRILLACLFGASLASLSASFTRELFGIHPMVVLGFLLAVLGVFVGLYHPAGLSFISRGVERKGRAMGIHGILGNLGLAAAPFSATWLASAFGWRSAFLVMAVPAAFLGVALLLNEFEVQEGTGKGSGSFSWKDLAPREEGPHRISPILLLYAISAFNGLTYRMILVYLPSYYRERIGEATFFSLSGMVLAGFLTTAVLLIGTIGQWGGGRLADRGNAERLYFLTFAVTAPLAWIVGRSTGAVLLLSSVIFSVVFFSMQPLKNYILAHHAPRKAQGLTFGFIFFLEFGIGSFGSSVGGAIADRWGLASVFYVCSILLALMACVAALLLPRRVSTEAVRAVT